MKNMVVIIVIAFLSFPSLLLQGEEYSAVVPVQIWTSTSLQLALDAEGRLEDFRQEVAEVFGRHFENSGLPFRPTLLWVRRGLEVPVEISFAGEVNHWFANQWGGEESAPVNCLLHYNPHLSFISGHAQGGTVGLQPWQQEPGAQVQGPFFTLVFTAYDLLDPEAPGKAMAHEWAHVAGNLPHGSDMDPPVEDCSRGVHESGVAPSTCMFWGGWESVDDSFGCRPGDRPDGANCPGFQSHRVRDAIETLVLEREADWTVAQVKAWAMSDSRRPVLSTLGLSPPP